MTIEDMTRDELILSLVKLYGFGWFEFDGQTMAEIWNDLDTHEQLKVEAYVA